MSRRVVDLNDRRTWPKMFRVLVEAAASAHGEDHWFDPWAEDDAIAALDDCLVRAYHCTRLTDRELGSVLNDGLSLLSPELATRRLKAAVADGHLSREEDALYSRTKLPSDPGRRGMVWLFTDRASLSNAHRSGISWKGGAAKESTWHGTAGHPSSNAWRVSVGHRS